MSLDITGLYIRAKLDGKVNSYDIMEVFVRDRRQVEEFLSTKKKEWSDNLSLILMEKIASLYSQLSQQH